MFTGRQLDEETGLYFYRARYYDSFKGRFLQRDALGYVDGMNLYAYVSDNPVNLDDPYGTEASKPTPLDPRRFDALIRDLDAGNMIGGTDREKRIMGGAAAFRTRQLAEEALIAGVSTLKTGDRAVLLYKLRIARAAAGLELTNAVNRILDKVETFERESDPLRKLLCDQVGNLGCTGDPNLSLGATILFVGAIQSIRTEAPDPEDIERLSIINCALKKGVRQAAASRCQACRWAASDLLNRPLAKAISNIKTHWSTTLPEKVAVALSESLDKYLEQACTRPGECK